MASLVRQPRVSVRRAADTHSAGEEIRHDERLTANVVE